MRIYLGTQPFGESAPQDPRVLDRAMRIYLGAQTNPGHGGAGPDNKAMGKAVKVYLGDSQGRGGKDLRAVGAQVVERPLRILLSFHYYRDEDVERLLHDSFGNRTIDVFADSGAFSAFTVGQPIVEAEYIAWVQRWGHLFSAVSAPDVIGNPQATYEATQRMRAQVQDVPVLPVFHVGEPWEFLQRYVDAGVEHLALGGMVPYVNRPKLLRAWLTKSMGMLRPGTRVHGFGLTTWSLLLQFPFYSVDSSSWTAGFRFANLTLFDRRKGQMRSVSMRKGAEMLKEQALLADYGLDAKDIHGDKYDRDRLVAVCVEAWQRAEAFLQARHGTARHGTARHGTAQASGSIWGRGRDRACPITQRLWAQR